MPLLKNLFIILFAIFSFPGAFNGKELASKDEVSKFEKLDLNGLCVFGSVADITGSNGSIEESCEDEKCQVGVKINSTTIWRSSSDQVFLKISVTPQGQTVQTLTHIYLNISYPDQKKSSFLVTVENLNGFHTDLLRSLEMDFPLDMNKLKSVQEEPVKMKLSLRSKCSCDGSFNQKDIEVLNLADIDDTLRSQSGSQCIRDETPISNIWLIVALCLTGTVVCGIAYISVVILQNIVHRREKKLDKPPPPLYPQPYPGDAQTTPL